MAVQILNQAFNPHDIGFDLVQITRTTNSAWATNVGAGSNAEVQFKNSLRKVIDACAWGRLERTAGAGAPRDH